MNMCTFPGCQRPPHNPTTKHARWTGGEGGWAPLAEQRTRAEARAERQDRTHREKAQRITANTLLTTFAGRQALGGGSITLDGVREMLTAATLAALTETENDR